MPALRGRRELGAGVGVPVAGRLVRRRPDRRHATSGRSMSLPAASRSSLPSRRRSPPRRPLRFPFSPTRRARSIWREQVGVEYYPLHTGRSDPDQCLRPPPGPDGATAEDHESWACSRRGLPAALPARLITINSRFQTRTGKPRRGRRPDRCRRRARRWKPPLCCSPSNW